MASVIFLLVTRGSTEHCADCDFYFWERGGGFYFASCYCSHAFSHTMLYHWCHVENEHHILRLFIQLKHVNWLTQLGKRLVVLCVCVCVTCNKPPGNHWIHRPAACLGYIRNKSGAVCKVELSQNKRSDWQPDSGCVDRKAVPAPELVRTQPNGLVRFIGLNWAE